MKQDLTIDINASGNNGLDINSEAETTEEYYYAWLIYPPYKPTFWQKLINFLHLSKINEQNSGKLLISKDNEPKIPSGYTFKHLVGKIKQDSG